MTERSSGCVHITEGKPYMWVTDEDEDEDEGLLMTKMIHFDLPLLLNRLRLKSDENKRFHAPAAEVTIKHHLLMNVLTFIPFYVLSEP